MDGWMDGWIQTLINGLTITLANHNKVFKYVYLQATRTVRTITIRHVRNTQRSWLRILCAMIQLQERSVYSSVTVMGCVNRFTVEITSAKYEFILFQ